MPRSASGVVVRRGRAAKPEGMRLFATTHAGLEEVLAVELRGLGAREIVPAVRGVAFRGDLELVYKANLWLRTASRVLVEIARFAAPDRRRLYDGARAIDWSRHMAVDQTLAVDAVSARSALEHTQFVSRVVKDAVVDWFRDERGRRPSVDAKAPDLRLNARLHENECTLSWDTSGTRLHRRGYRSTLAVPAPLQETLAAGVLLLSGYDGSRRLVDPMCGSGTLVVEAAMIARRIAPGLLGRKFALVAHPSFDKVLWTQLREGAAAMAREVEGCPINGADISAEAVRATAVAARGAGVDDVLRVRQAALEDLAPLDEGCMIVTNPPYGERLGEIQALGDLYRTLGDVLKRRCVGASAHVLTGSKFLAKQIGLRTAKRDILWNGPIECRLLHYRIH